MRPSFFPSRTSTSCSRCRARSATSPTNKAVIYDLLFKASSETLITIAADPKHLGANIGMTAVLHTWGSAMTHHPHVHMIVPGGGTLGRRPELDRREADLLPSRARALQVVPPPHAGEARGRARGWKTRLLRRSCAARRRQCVRQIPRTAAQAALVRLRQAPLRRAESRARLSRHAIPTGSPSRTAG